MAIEGREKQVNSPSMISTHSRKMFKYFKFRWNDGEVGQQEKKYQWYKYYLASVYEKMYRDLNVLNNDILET
jgi:hypothetical protein